MSESPQDATAALQELEDQLVSGKKAVSEPAPSVAAERKKEEPGPAAPEKKTRRVFFEGGPSRKLTAIRGWVTELARSLHHWDYLTRRGARLFFASLVGLALVISLAGHRYWNHIKDLRAHAARIARQHNALLAEFLRKRAEIAHRKNSMLLLGGFNLALQAEPGERVPGSSSYRLAEIELVVECDSKESRDFLEEHLAQARDEVTNAFGRVDRQDLMSAEGKTRLKRALRERLNLMLPKGRVDSVYFSKLILT